MPLLCLPTIRVLQSLCSSRYSRVLPCVFSVMHCNVSMESHTRTCVLFEAALAPTPTFSSVSFDTIAFAVACACACVVYVCKRACVCVRGGGWRGGISSISSITPNTQTHTHIYTSRASVAQLVRARDCQSLGRRFDSV